GQATPCRHACASAVFRRPHADELTERPREVDGMDARFARQVHDAWRRGGAFGDSFPRAVYPTRPSRFASMPWRMNRLEQQSQTVLNREWIERLRAVGQLGVEPQQRQRDRRGFPLMRGLPEGRRQQELVGQRPPEPDSEQACARRPHAVAVRETWWRKGCAERVHCSAPGAARNFLEYAPQEQREMGVPEGVRRTGTRLPVYRLRQQDVSSGQATPNETAATLGTVSHGVAMKLTPERSRYGRREVRPPYEARHAATISSSPP